MTPEEKQALQEEWQRQRDALALCTKKIQKLENMLNPLRIQYCNIAQRFREIDYALALERKVVVKAIKAKSKSKSEEELLMERLASLTPQEIDRLVQTLNQAKGK
jgi:7-keto-8-aminopelargonate synthetase-like enzyme